MWFSLRSLNALSQVQAQQLAVFLTAKWMIRQSQEGFNTPQVDPEIGLPKKDPFNRRQMPRTTSLLGYHMPIL